MKSPLFDEFRLIRKYFDPVCQAIWKRGLRWINTQDRAYGHLSWEPFFVGLLSEENAFAGRSIEASFNRKRLLHRLSQITHENDVYPDEFRPKALLNIRDIKEEFRPLAPGETSGDFFTNILDLA